MRNLRLLRYARPHWRGLTLLVATLGVTVSLELLKPWPMKLLVDNVVGDEPWPGWLAGVVDGPRGLLALIVAGTVVIFLAATLTSMLYSLVQTRIGQRMAYDLGADLFLHLQRLSLIFHSRRPVGDTIARVTGDPYCVQVLVMGALLPLIQSVATLVAMFVIMWALEPRLTVLALGVVPFLGLAIRIYSRPMKETSRATRDLEGHMMSVVQLALNAVPAVQAFTREELEHSRFRSYADQTVRAYVRATLASLWFKLFVGLVTAVGTAGLMYLGGTYVLDGKMSVGTLLVFLAYLGSLYVPLNSITQTASTWQYAAARADRVMEILNTQPDIVDHPGAIDAKVVGHVRYEYVTFGYEPPRTVVKAISFEARPGEVVAIVGPTGAGKTTLVNLLARFFDPWGGKITIDGIDIRNLRVRCLREQISMVLQESFVFPLSVADNIAYGKPDATRDEIESAARAANAHEFIVRLPKGYDTIVGERGATLSGGERQRLSIARAFVKNAPILILDEPTSALDARTEAALLDALDRLMAGRVTFIIAHRLSTIRNADQILVVDNGRIVQRGRHSELVEQGGLYATLYRQQMDHVRHDVVTADLITNGSPGHNDPAVSGAKRSAMQVRT